MKNKETIRDISFYVLSGLSLGIIFGMASFGINIIKAVNICGNEFLDKAEEKLSKEERD